MYDKRFPGRVEMKGLGIFWIDREDAADSFPPPSQALREPNGLLAAGGDVVPERLLAAYPRGIFPWYNEGQPVLWWSPDPRAVLLPGEIRVNRSLRKRLRNAGFEISLDTAFEDVIDACARIERPSQPEPGTWITSDMRETFLALHERGYAHSVEAWRDGELAGGLYGIAIGRVFFGESMFSRITDASKVALVWLCRQLQAWDFPILDCQVESAHMRRLGALEIPRSRFLEILDRHCRRPPPRPGTWRFDENLRVEP